MGYDAKLHHVVIEDELELRAGAKVLNRDGNDVAAQLDVLDTISSADLTKIDGITDGTATASRAVVLDANKHVDEINTASLKLGATGATVAVTATAAQLNALAGASAGIAAVLAGGLGGSASFTKASAATTTLIAANATKDRAVLVVVVVDETYDIGTGTLPTVEIGEDDTIDKCMAHTVLDSEAAGTVLVFSFTNTATKKIIVTTTAAVGNATGGCTITAIAIPTT